MKLLPKNQNGYSLVELLVVITILGAMVMLSLTFIDPKIQLNKASDSKRTQDLAAIKQALDLYYNDTGCYPASIPFGSRWEQGSSLYMPKVPQDPECERDSTKCYVYQTSQSASCPQWNVLFSRLAKTQTNSSACSLTDIAGCSPSDMTNEWYCTASGSVDCSYMSSVSLEDSP